MPPSSPRTVERVTLRLSVQRDPAVMQTTALVLFSGVPPPPSTSRRSPAASSTKRLRASLALATRPMTPCEEAAQAEPSSIERMDDGNEKQLVTVLLDDGASLQAPLVALAGHSEVLQTMLASARWREGAHGELALTAHPAAVVRSVVEWMVAARGAPKRAAAERALSAAHVVETAKLCHFLELGPLLAPALRVIVGAVDAANAPSCLLLARQLGAAELEEAAVRVMLGSLDAVEREAEAFWEDLPSLTRETLRALRDAALRNPLAGRSVAHAPVQPRELLACVRESLRAQLERLDEARARNAQLSSGAGGAGVARPGEAAVRAAGAIDEQAKRVRALQSYLTEQEMVFAKLLAAPDAAGAGSARGGAASGGSGEGGEGGGACSAAAAASPGLVAGSSYDWVELPSDGDGGAALRLPAGLEIDLPLDGTSPRRARIPPRWRLCVWTGDERGFWRCDATRRMGARELRRSAADFLDAPLERVRLRLGAATVDDAATVEELGLFGRVRELSVEVTAGSGLRV